MIEFATTTPGGHPARFVCRERTNDTDMVIALVQCDGYRLKGRNPQGWALDIGAHIGTVSVLLALDNPQLKVVAVEPVPQNVELLSENIRMNGLSGRVSVVQLAAGAPDGTPVTICYGYRHYEGIGDSYTAAHKWVAGTFGSRGDPEFTLTVPVVSLPRLLNDFGIAGVSLCKIDCEGAEWEFFNTDTSMIDRIVGEFHALLPDAPGYDPMVREKLVKMLPNHAVEFWDNETVVGAFEAKRK